MKSVQSQTGTALAGRTIYLSVFFTPWDTLYSSPRSPVRLKINALVEQQPICPWLWQKLGSIKALHRYSLVGPPSKASAWHSNTPSMIDGIGMWMESLEQVRAIGQHWHILLPLPLLSHCGASDSEMTATLSSLPSGYHSRQQHSKS